MPRPRRHTSDLALLDAVRQELEADPDISHAELRSRIGGTQTMVSAAMRAALVEAGRLTLAEGEAVDPQFAHLIQMPEPPVPLDLRTAVPEQLARSATDHLDSLKNVVQSIVENIQGAAVAAMDQQRQALMAMVQSADARATRANQFMESLQREIAEVVAETERMRAVAVQERASARVEVEGLRRDLAESRDQRARDQEAQRSAIAQRDAAITELTNARQDAVTMVKELSSANARVHELEHRAADLASRLSRAEGDIAASRAAENEAREAAAAARATAAEREAMLRRIDGTAAVEPSENQAERGKSKVGADGV